MCGQAYGLLVFFLGGQLRGCAIGSYMLYSFQSFFLYIVCHESMEHVSYS